jgi:hypothetical protein
MRLFLYDKFFEKFIELPRAIQNKVLDFQKKFRENSRSAAIHLEPIKSFIDQSLRTARIDEKYRAILRVPESGDDYFLLWVDVHDEAMSWAQNKMITWNPNTQAVQIFTAPEKQVEAESEKTGTPKKSLFGNLTDDQLFAIGVPSLTLPLVKEIQSLDDLEALEKNLPEDAFENLFYLSDGAEINNIIFEIEEGKVKSESIENQVQSINNKRSFVEVNDDLLQELINGELKKWQVFLHPSQRKLVERSFKGSIKVTGGGGTGKTVAALHRLKFLTTENDIRTTQPVLFATYTNALTENLRKLIQGMEVPHNTYYLANIDSLAREQASKAGIISKESRFLDFPNTKPSLELWDEVLEQTLCQFDAQFLHSEYQDVFLYHDIQSPEQYYNQSRIGRGKAITRKQRMEVWSVVQVYQQRKKEEHFLDRAEVFNKLALFFSSQKVKPFSHVIVDEVQDFSNIELRFIRSLVEENDNDLFMVGDPYQRIYQRKINFSAAGINIRGTRSKRLRINYRTTEEIKRLAISIVKGYSYDNFEGESEKLDGYLSLIHGVKPSYHLFSTKAEEVSFILKSIKEDISAGLVHGEITIAARLKDSLREIKSTIHQNSFPYFDVTSQSGKLDGIQLSTFHSLKGLESKVVYLMDVNYRTAPFLPHSFAELESIQKEEHLLSERALLYVAVTRAIQKVVITGTGTKSELIKV